MNANLSIFLTALSAVAASAVLALALAEPPDTVQPAPQAIVKLERVVVIGKAVRPAGPVNETVVAQRIETLPRVVIEGRRTKVAVTEVAMAQACTLQVGC